jgi:hypothetical protein
MSSKASTQLDRYLHENHNVGEDQLITNTTVAGPRKNVEQAVAELDWYMENVTDRDVLQVARQEHKSIMTCPVLADFVLTILIGTDTG